MSQLQFGLLSCGNMARHQANALNKLPRARIAKVFDAFEPPAKEFGEKLGVPWSTDVNDILNDPAIDAVIIATPNYTHTEYVLAAAKAGKHVFCEKPFALTTADCDRAIAACQAAGVHLVVGQVLRYLPVFDNIKRILDQGTLGEPFAVRISRLGGWGHPQPWRNRRDQSGGPLYEINAHELDFMRYILGEPERVYATGSQKVVTQADFEDTAFVSINFAGGRHGVLHSSIADALGGYTGVIECTEGTLRFTNWPSLIEWKRFDGQSGTLKDAEITAPDAHQRELGHLVDAILDGVPPAITGADGRAAVAMAQAAYASMQSGQPVAIASL